MEFKITSTIWQINELFDRYPSLTKFGVEVRQVTIMEMRYAGRDANGWLIRDLVPTKVECAFVKIDNLEQLIELQKTVNQELIINSDSIEIYDGCRE